MKIYVDPGISDIRIGRSAEEGQLARLFIENRSTSTPVVRTPYIGRVTSINPNLQAAFVDIGEEEPGILRARDIAYDAGRERKDISSLLAEGDTVLVSIQAEPVDGKGARLSGDIPIAGRYFVMMRGRSKIQFSRKLRDDEEREWFTELIEDMIAEIEDDKFADHWGFIVRTEAQDADDEMLEAELEWLIKEAQGLDAKLDQEPPARLWDETERVRHTIENFFHPSVEGIEINDEALANALSEQWKGQRDDLIEILSTEAARTGSYEDGFDFDDEVDAALASKIGLPSGGWIKMEETEAMTVVDVNTGSADIGGSYGETIFRTNMEAADEVFRQLELRALGGMIAIDFIDMKSERYQDGLRRKLDQNAQQDPEPVRVAEMSDPSLTVLTRRRTRTPLAERLTRRISPAWEETSEATAGRMLRQLEREMKADGGAQFTVACAPKVKAVIDQLSGKSKGAFDSRIATRAEFIADEALASDGFDIKAKD